MQQFLALFFAIISACHAVPGSLEVDLGALRRPSLRNAVFSVNKQIGKLKVDLGYDFNGHRDFLKTLSGSGSLLDKEGMSLSAKGTYNFPDETMQLDLSAQTGGLNVKGDVHSKTGLGKITAGGSFDAIKGKKMSMSSSYAVAGKRLGLDLSHGIGESDSVSVETSLDVSDPKDFSYKLKYGRKMTDSVTTETTLDVQNRHCKVKLSDSKRAGEGATLEVTAGVPLDSSFQEKASISVGLKRDFSF